METKRPPSLEGFLSSLIQRDHSVATIKVELSPRSGAIILTIGASRNDATERAVYAITGNVAMPMDPEKT